MRVVDAVPDGHEDDLDLRNVARPDDLILVNVGVDHAAGRAVEDPVLVERVVNALYDAPMYLALRGQRVDDEAAVVDGDDSLHAHEPRLRVHFDFRELRAGREPLPGVRVVLGALAGGRDSLRRKLRAGVFPGEAPRGATALGENAFGEGDALRVDSPFLRQELGDAPRRLVSGRADDRSARRRRRRAAGCGSVGHTRVADPDCHALQREGEFLRRYDSDPRARAGAEVLQAVDDLGRAVAVD